MGHGVVFHVWLPSLQSRFQGSSKLRHESELRFSLWPNSISLCRRVAFCRSVHFTEGRVGRFYFLAVVNDAAVNGCEQFSCGRVFFVPFASMHPGAEFQGCAVVKEMSTPQPEARALRHLGPAHSSRHAPARTHPLPSLAPVSNRGVQPDASCPFAGACVSLTSAPG